MRLAAIALAAALLPAPVMSEDADHVSRLGDVRAVHAWTRATDGAEALVFVEIENEGDAPVMLIGAQRAGVEATLVGFRLQDGIPVYDPVGAVPVAPGRDLHLEPDGLAIRMTGLTDPLVEGDAVELSLVTSLGELTIHVAVEAADATQHGHAGHDH